MFQLESVLVIIGLLIFVNGELEGSFKGEHREICKDLDTNQDYYRYYRFNSKLMGDDDMCKDLYTKCGDCYVYRRYGVGILYTYCSDFCINLWPVNITVPSRIGYTNLCKDYCDPPYDGLEFCWDKVCQPVRVYPAYDPICYAYCITYGNVRRDFIETWMIRLFRLTNNHDRKIYLKATRDGRMMLCNPDWDCPDWDCQDPMKLAKLMSYIEDHNA